MVNILIITTLQQNNRISFEQFQYLKNILKELGNTLYYLDTKIKIIDSKYLINEIKLKNIDLVIIYTPVSKNIFIYKSLGVPIITFYNEIRLNLTLSYYFILNNSFVVVVTNNQNKLNLEKYLPFVPICLYNPIYIPECKQINSTIDEKLVKKLEGRFSILLNLDYLDGELQFNKLPSLLEKIKDTDYFIILNTPKVNFYTGLIDTIGINNITIENRPVEELFYYSDVYLTYLDNQNYGIDVLLAQIYGIPILTPDTLIYKDYNTNGLYLDNIEIINHGDDLYQLCLYSNIVDKLDIIKSRSLIEKNKQRLIGQSFIMCNSNKEKLTTTIKYLIGRIFVKNHKFKIGFIQIDKISPNNERYCIKNGYDIILVKLNKLDYYIRDNIYKYKYLFVLDVDTLIVNYNVDIEDELEYYLQGKKVIVGKNKNYIINTGLVENFTSLKMLIGDTPISESILLPIDLKDFSTDRFTIYYEYSYLLDIRPDVIRYLLPIIKESNRLVINLMSDTKLIIGKNKYNYDFGFDLDKGLSYIKLANGNKKVEFSYYKISNKLIEFSSKKDVLIICSKNYYSIVNRLEYCLKWEYDLYIGEDYLGLGDDYNTLVKINDEFIINNFTISIDKITESSLDKGIIHLISKSPKISRNNTSISCDIDNYNSEIFLLKNGNPDLQKLWLNRIV